MAIAGEVEIRQQDHKFGIGNRQKERRGLQPLNCNSLITIKIGPCLNVESIPESLLELICKMRRQSFLVNKLAELEDNSADCNVGFYL